MDAFFTGFMLLRGRLGTSLLMCFSLVNYLACIPEIELFYDQVVLFQFFQRIPHGTGSELAPAHNFFVGHGPSCIEHGEDCFR